MFVPDPNIEADPVPGIDRHFYENQVPPSSPFNDTSFARAAARAKDEARHQMIKAVRNTAERAVADRGRLEELRSFGSGERITWTRTIDGIEGAPDNDIKL